MRWIQDPVTLELIPADEWMGPSESKTAYVVEDIKPYRSPLDGSIVSSRSQHRAHMKAHGVIEVGNEKLTRPATKKPEVNREQLRRDIADTLSGYGI